MAHIYFADLATPSREKGSRDPSSVFFFAIQFSETDVEPNKTN